MSTETTPAAQWAHWTRIYEKADAQRAEATRRRAAIAAAEVARQAEIHGERGAKRRAADALGVTPGRISQLLQAAETDRRAALTEETRTVEGRTWARTVMGAEGHRGCWRTDGPDGEWVLYTESAPDAGPSTGRTPSGDLAPVARWTFGRRGGGREEYLRGVLTEDMAMAEATRLIAD